MKDNEVVNFFNDTKPELIMLGMKTKLNKEKERRLRFDFAMKLTAVTLGFAPENVKESFYLVCKPLSINPIGIEQTFRGAHISFFDTAKSRSASLKLSNCDIKAIEVIKPDKAESELQDGDVRLLFCIDVLATKEIIGWFFDYWDSHMFAEFSETQLVVPEVKNAQTSFDPAQMKLGEEGKTEGEATTPIDIGKKKGKKKK
jgi:hypothetical protein